MLPRSQFTIRDLILVTAGCALIAGWWVDHRRLSSSCSALVEAEWRVQVLSRFMSQEGYRIKWLENNTGLEIRRPAE